MEERNLAPGRNEVLEAIRHLQSGLLDSDLSRDVKLQVYKDLGDMQLKVIADMYPCPVEANKRSR